MLSAFADLIQHQEDTLSEGELAINLFTGSLVPASCLWHISCWQVRPTLKLSCQSSQEPLSLACGFYHARVWHFNVTLFNSKDGLGASLCLNIHHLSTKWALTPLPQDCPKQDCVHPQACKCLHSSMCSSCPHAAHLMVAGQARTLAWLPVLAEATWPSAWLLPCLSSMHWSPFCKWMNQLHEWTFFLLTIRPHGPPPSSVLLPLSSVSVINSQGSWQPISFCMTHPRVIESSSSTLWVPALIFLQAQAHACFLRPWLP